MTEEELVDYLKNRQLNIKTNNMIITKNENNKIIDSIPETSSISFIGDDLDIKLAYNIKVNLFVVQVNDIFSYLLNRLKEMGLIEETFNYVVPFDSKLSILRFENLLRNRNIVVQLFFYNLDELSEEEQMLFNELYYYNSSYFSVISFVREHFITYFLNNDRVLDDREDYQRLEIVKPFILSKELN